ncbi:hypothetical protein ACQ5SO_16915 [Rhodovulum sp. DZ06]|uniref:hypothetical protein n=1 Tax=Rhodovulum sp. DZ06 TaxID=3425126 RepID=UPI003D3375C5
MICARCEEDETECDCPGGPHPAGRNARVMRRRAVAGRALRAAAAPYGAPPARRGGGMKRARSASPPPREALEEMSGAEESDGEGDAMDGLDAAPSWSGTESETGEEKEEARRVNIGDPMNTFAAPGLRMRTGFWNVQNFTGDLVKQGMQVRREPLDSDRNAVRLEFLADVILGLEVDSFVILEMGSDAQAFLDALADRLNAACAGDGRPEWTNDISVDSGALVEPPTGAFDVDLSAWGDVERRVWALQALLPYYRMLPEHYVFDPPSGQRRLDAQIWLAKEHRRLHAALVLLDKAQDKPADPGEFDLRILAALHADGLLPPGLDPADPMATPPSPDHPHFTLWMLMAIGRDDFMELVAGLGEFHAGLLSLHAVICQAGVRMAPRPDHPDGPPPEDGPLHALRILGVYVGRYEKYGAVRRGRPLQCLLHDMVETEARTVGRRLNGRPAWDVKLPMSAEAVRAFLIHAMWTPAASGGGPDPDRGRSPEDLRVETLALQAEAGAGADGPVFIAGDANVPRRKLADLDARMGAHGFRRSGAVENTTLRQEKTIRTAAPGDDGAFLNEPYDCVYVNRAREGEYTCHVHFPCWEERVMRAAFIARMVEHEVVRDWYVELLREALLPIWHMACRSRTAFPKARAAERARAAALVEKPPGSLEDWRGLIAALEALAGELGDRLPAEVRAEIARFTDLGIETRRLFLLFHRRFISDHRLVLIDVAKRGWEAPWTGDRAGDVGALKGKVSADPFAAPAEEDGRADAVTPAGNGRRRCLAQGRNTCGMRAVFNLLDDDPAGPDAHDRLWALAAATLAPGGGFDVGMAVNMADDEVARVIERAGHDATIPVVAQFLQLDAMLEGVIGADPGVAGLRLFRDAWRAWDGGGRVGPPPAGELRLVMHTSADWPAFRRRGVGHWFAVRIRVGAAGGLEYVYMDSLDRAVDRRALIEAFIDRFIA